MKKIGCSISVAFLSLFGFGVLGPAVGTGGVGGDDHHRLPSAAARAESIKRPVSAADAVGFAEVGEPDLNFHNREVAKFSPDGKRFVVEMRKPNIQNNTNDYQLLLFQADRVFKSPQPVVVASFSSSSNRAAIEDVEWLDNRVIAFLGENPGEARQLYTVDSDTCKVTRLTSHATNLSSYTINPSADRFVFTAETSINAFQDEQTLRRGLVVNEETLSDLIALQSHRQSAENHAVFSQKKGSAQEFLLQSRGINSFVASFPAPALSPNGRYVVVSKRVTGDSPPPASWIGYEDDLIQKELREHRFDGPLLALNQLELLDTESGKAETLIDAPIGFGHSEVAWASDGHSVVVCGTYLPLDKTQAEDIAERKIKRFVAEINISTRTIIPITNQDLRLRQWDHQRDLLIFQTNTGPVVAASYPGGDIVEYQRTDAGWKRVKAGSYDLRRNKDIAIELQQDVNTPPRLVARSEAGGASAIVFDPNPQLQDLKRGRVEEITFRTKFAHVAQGVIYLPVDYVPGVRYPLVIQTHAFEMHRGKFLMDGPYSTAFAAQPLAGRGFLVAQLEMDINAFERPDEVLDEASMYESAIAYLDERGLIDVSRIGIIGFSRTGLYVEYALTHSKYHFAAAELADISDAGYFRYIALLNKPGFGRDSEIANGGIPFGDGLHSWLKNSPGFNLDKVTAAVRLESDSDQMPLLFEWEWFVGLKKLGKPVELVYIVNGSHTLVKPWNRLTSLQGTVDWFCFWLKGEEDPDPDKAEQYTRWRELRRQQKENQRHVNTH